jgi:UDP-N-acetylmuramate--alanine ligase
VTTLPLDIGPLHFVGIGGIGMSGIAELLHNLGYRVQGSDQADNANTLRLRALGIPVTIGHDEANLGDARAVVYSSAVKPSNPELAGARQRLLPVVRRAEMLAELMRLKWSIAVGGTHGKTTTTSLLAAVLEAAGMDPTVVIGGILNAWGSNAKLGSGDWMVAEADESDGSFLKLPATVAVVTNIDAEHLDHYGDFAALREAFVTFVTNIPFYGFAVLCLDHPEVQAMIPRVSDRRLITYGLSPQADVRGTRLRIGAEGIRFDVTLADRKSGSSRTWPDLMLPMVGRHNVLNALATIAVGSEIGIGEATFRSALAGFGGINRRFTKVGEVDGVTVVDDYGHHPVEIAAVLSAARAVAPGRVVAVVQPHRYSRLHSLFHEFCGCFNDADTVIVADVYAAGEDPVNGASRDLLVEGLRAHGHRHVLPLAGPERLAETLDPLVGNGDFVICLGAGTITRWAQALPGQLQALRDGDAEVRR